MVVKCFFDILPQILQIGPNIWIVNEFPWWPLNLDQCICVNIKQSNPNSTYPIQPIWIDNLLYIGREIIGVEFLKGNDEDLTDVSIQQD